MNSFRALTFATAIAAATGSAVAQCSNYSLSPAGTVIIDADDAIRNVALPFAFPFNGNLYTSITISTNGWIKLGATSNVSSDLGDTEALMLSAEPRIAVCWDDLNPGPAGSGDLFYSADPSQASITWQGVQRYGTAQTGTLANCECVLLPSGEIFLIYDATSTFNLSNSTAIVGISAGGNLVPAGTHLHNWSLANPGPLSIVDSTGYELFGIGGFDLLSGVTLTFVPTGLNTYSVVQVPTLGACTQQASYPGLAVGPTSFGTGCPTPIPNGAIYEEFTIDSGASPLDTSNTSMRFVAGGEVYILTPGPGFDPNYTGGTTLTMADDQVLAVPVGAVNALLFADLVVTSVGVCSNGFLWLDGSTVADLSPTQAELFANGPRIAGCWKDLNPVIGGTIYVNDTDPNFFMVTWSSVPEYANPTSLCTFQIKFWANGDIDINHQTVSSISDAVIVGISRGNGAAGASDNLVTAGQVNVVGPVDIFGVPATPMVHSSTQMAFGRLWTLSATVGANNGIGLFLAGTSNPNLPLDFLGAFGCNLYSTLDVTLLAPIIGNSFSVPAVVMPYNNALAGLVIYSQAAALSNDNPFGIITSNGLSHTFGL